MDIPAERDSPCISVKKLNSGTRKCKRYDRTSDVMKNLRLCTHELAPDCKCQLHQCFEVIPIEDVKRIIKEFNALCSVDEQNAYLCGLITRSLKKNNGNGTERRLGKYDYKHCSMPEEVTESVISNFSSFKGRQSHYSRKNSERVYLPDTLNINRMYEIHKEYYSKIVNTRFSIAFGYPRNDTCSSCDKYQADVTALQHTLSAQVANDVHNRKAELPKHWVEVFESARTKPSPYHVVNVHQLLLRNWTQYLTSLYTKTCPIATRPLNGVVLSVQEPRLIKLRSTYNGMWETAVMAPQKSLLSQVKELQLDSGESLLPGKGYQGKK
ncbi:hypothetical protein PR048_016239 [Dryococelus australis]|uniref:Uncharacterized protein n=1 Tax=Dryococelus australis TaxID=614101 RepID=A0ABQ9HJ61_9NEOP|nr:hypothetical protein PR048_016239 [Dryococelus australis]